jgi:hypothetical protein
MTVPFADRVPNHKMCSVCFEYTPFGDLWVENGDKYDMCRPCGSYNLMCGLLLEAGYERPEIINIFRYLTDRAVAVRMEA